MAKVAVAGAFPRLIAVFFTTIQLPVSQPTRLLSPTRLTKDEYTGSTGP